MKLLSSHLTFFYKRILPVLWLGGTALIGCFGLASGVIQRDFEAAFPLIGPAAFWFAFGCVMLRLLFFNLVDEVWDCETHLLIRNRGVEELVAYEDCLDVHCSVYTNPQRCTVLFNRRTVFGTSIVFAPHLSLVTNTPAPAARDLMARIKAAKQNPSTKLTAADM